MVPPWLRMERRDLLRRGTSPCGAGHRRSRRRGGRVQLPAVQTSRARPLLRAEQVDEGPCVCMRHGIVALCWPLRPRGTDGRPRNRARGAALPHCPTVAAAAPERTALADSHAEAVGTDTQCIARLPARRGSPGLPAKHSVCLPGRLGHSSRLRGEARRRCCPQKAAAPRGPRGRGAATRRAARPGRPAAQARC